MFNGFQIKWIFIHHYILWSWTNFLTSLNKMNTFLPFFIADDEQIFHYKYKNFGKWIKLFFSIRVYTIECSARWIMYVKPIIYKQLKNDFIQRTNESLIINWSSKMAVIIIIQAVVQLRANCLCEIKPPSMSGLYYYT